MLSGRERERERERERVREREKRERERDEERERVEMTFFYKPYQVLYAVPVLRLSHGHFTCQCVSVMACSSTQIVPQLCCFYCSTFFKTATAHSSIFVVHFH